MERLEANGDHKGFIFCLSLARCRLGYTTTAATTGRPTRNTNQSNAHIAMHAS